MQDGNPGEIDFGWSWRQVRDSEGSSYWESTVEIIQLQISRLPFPLFYFPLFLNFKLFSPLFFLHLFLFQSDAQLFLLFLRDESGVVSEDKK